MAMEFISLASGSSGNCHLIRTASTAILVDAGMTGRYIKHALADLAMNLSDIDAVVISHEHQDHISGLGVIARQSNIRIYITEATYQASLAVIGKVNREQISFIQDHLAFTIGDILVVPHPIMHDAVDPLCFLFQHGEHRVAVVTDLGEINDELVDFLQEADLLLLEANHDYQMLIDGVYPYPLKQRVLSTLGHLSNHQTAELSAKLIQAGKLKILILGHLSGENNHPELAYETVKNKLAELGYLAGRDYILDISYRGFVGNLYRLGN